MHEEKKMKITKGEKFYFVNELSGKWFLKRKEGEMTVKFEVPKEICATEEELRRYVLENDMF